MRAAPVIAILYFIPARQPRRPAAVLGLHRQVRALRRRGAGHRPKPVGPDWLIWVVIAAGAATSLLTLYALMRAWNLAFWRDGTSSRATSRCCSDRCSGARGRYGHGDPHHPRLMIAATATLVIVTVCLTVFAGPLFDFAGRAAEGLGDPSIYVSVVFPGGAR